MKMTVISEPIYAEDGLTITLPVPIDNLVALRKNSATGELEVLHTYEDMPGIVHEPTIEDAWRSQVDKWRESSLRRMQLTKAEFLQMVTAEEHATIKANTATDPVIDHLWEILKVAEYVDLTDETTTNGLAYLYAQGLLPQETYDKIMQGLPLD